MTAQIIYSTDFKAKAEKERETALSDIDHIAGTVIKAALADDFVIPALFVADEKDPA